MPPDLLLPKFQGLHTVEDPDEGEFGQLIKAVNVRFDRTGCLRNRPGFRFFAQGPTIDAAQMGGASRQITYFLGELRMNDGNVYTAFNAEGDVDPNIGGKFYWGNTVGSTLSSTVSSGSPSAGGLFNGFGVSASKKFGIVRTAGTQYNSVLVFVNGMRFRIIAGVLDMDTAPGFPVVPDGWGSMATHKDRVWVAPKLVGATAASPSRLYFSDAGGSSSWPSTNFVDVGAGQEDGPITQVLSFQGRFIIFKLQGMWILETTGAPTAWSLRQYSDKGCVGRCASVHDTGIYWIGQQGAFRWDGTSFEDIGAPIQNLFDNGGIVDALNCNSVVYEDQFYCWVALKNGTKKFLVYNILLQQWTELQTGLEAAGTVIINFFSRNRTPRYVQTTQTGPPTQHVVTEDFGPPGVFITVSDESDRPRVYSMLEGNPGSDGTLLAIGPPITHTERGLAVDIQTKFADLEEPATKKRVHRWEMELSGPPVTITQYDEEGRSRADTVTPTSSSFVRLGGLGYFRKVSLRFQASAMSINQLKLKRIMARISMRGRQIKNEVNQYQ